MTFLNGTLLFGALAAAVPLILHILNRSRFRRVEWGAMHLLEAVIKVNHKRFQFEQWILLLVRCAIPALLALCLARPVLTGSRILAGDSPVSLVILLDTSYSMDAVSDGRSQFEKAVDAAVAIVENTSPGSEVSVIQTGGLPTPMFDQPVFDRAAVVRRLKTLAGGYGASDVRQALNTGLATLAGMTHARRELVLISDFQPDDWKAGGDLTIAIRQQVDALPIKPQLTFLQIGERIRNNLSIESLDFAKRPLGVGQPLAVRANIRNHGDVATENVRVILRIDDAEQATSQISLAANGTTQTFFPVEFDRPGSHVLKVELATTDPLTTDDSFAATVTIWDQINVLLVDGDPSSQPLKGETDYLSVALTPYAFGRLKLSDLVRTRTVRADSLTSEMLADFKVVTLANVPKLKDDQISLLQDYVRDGGALFVCPGNRIDLKWYNDKLYAECGLLPARFGEPRGQIKEAGPGAHVIAQHFAHPALEFFNDPANGDLSSAEIRQWYELEPGPPTRRLTFRTSTITNHNHPFRPTILTRLPQTGRRPTSVVEFSTKYLQPGTVQPATGPVVLARLDNGDPFLVEHAFADGTVLQMATSCDADWSDLPLRSFYVPLMQQLMTTLATQLTPPRNIQTGDPAVVILNNPESAPDVSENAGGLSEDVAALWSLTMPDGARRSLAASPRGDRLVARFEDTRRPGLYTMRTPTGEEIHFVASTSRDESNLEMLDEDGLQTLGTELSARVVATTADYLAQDRLSRHGQEIWKPVLMALLALMYLELVLQQRFAKVRS